MVAMTEDRPGFSRTALRIAWRELWASPAKFVFVVLAVAAGVGSLTGVRGFSESFRGMLLDKARTLMAADIAVVDFNVPTAAQMASVDKMLARGMRMTRLPSCTCGSRPVAISKYRVLTLTRNKSAASLTVSISASRVGLRVGGSRLGGRSGGPGIDAGRMNTPVGLSSSGGFGACPVFMNALPQGSPAARAAQAAVGMGESRQQVAVPRVALRRALL